MDDVEFNLVRNAQVFGSAVRVLGLDVYHYERGQQMNCFAMCAAASDCAAFVDHRLLKYCAFKAHGAKVHEDQSHTDLYVRLPSPAVPTVPPPLSAAASLSGEHRIYSVPSFISNEEASTLLRMARRCFGRRRAATAGNVQLPPVPIGSPSCEAGAQAVLLSRVEERIAQLTEMPTHEGEETLMFSQMRAAGADGPWFQNVHHDKNKQERREATVLIYLSSQRDDEGGHTVFPTLPHPTKPLNGTTRAKLEAHAVGVRDAFAGGRRALGCRDEPGCIDAGGLVAHTEAECSRALSGEESSLALRPTRGTALVFWSVRPDGSPDSAVWHTACIARALGASGRWAMQKFKSRTLADFSTCAAPAGPALGPAGLETGDSPT